MQTGIQSINSMLDWRAKQPPQDGRPEVLRLRLPVGTKPRTSHHRSPGEERHRARERQRSPIHIERTITPGMHAWFQKQNLENFPETAVADMGIPEGLDIILN